MNLLEKAIAIALQAHAGQMDRAGKTYLLHPLRLMLQMKTDEERIVAVLHDVVEDSEFTLEYLKREGFPKEIVDAVDSVTKREGEDYDAFIERIAQNPLASRVKIADMKDNADLTRLPEVTEKDRTRTEKYLRAIERLEEVFK